MLEFFRQHIGRGLVGVLLVGMLALAFAFTFGAQSKGWGAGQSAQLAAVADGYDIPDTTLDYAYYLLGGRSLNPNEGEGASLKLSALEGLIERSLLLALAEDVGITASSEEAVERIVTSEIYLSRPIIALAERMEAYPFFDPKDASTLLVSQGHRIPQSFENDEGNFNVDFYKSYIKNQLRQTEEDFVEQQRLEIVAERMRQLIAHLGDYRRPSILIVRGLEQLFGQGPTGAGTGELLRPSLARGELRLLASTTPEGRRRVQERDPETLRLFTELTVEPPTVEEATEILRGISGRYEQHHKIQISDSAITAAVRLARRYLQDRFLPDSAIDLLDESASAKRVEVDGIPAAMDDVLRRVDALKAQLASLDHADDAASGEAQSPGGASILSSRTAPPRSTMCSKNFIPWAHSSCACKRIHLAVPGKFCDSNQPAIAR